MPKFTEKDFIESVITDLTWAYGEKRRKVILAGFNNGMDDGQRAIVEERWFVLAKVKNGDCNSWKETLYERGYVAGWNAANGHSCTE